MAKEYTPTPDQKKVLENKSEKAIISASAGTGKTATIVQYIAQLIEKGMPVSRLLAVTFTNNAADEMKERLLAELMERNNGDRLLDQIDDLLTADICTIHSFLQKLIKKNIDKTNVAENFYLLDDIKRNNIRNNAFNKTYEEICNDSTFSKIILIIAKEKKLIKNIIFSLEEFFSSQVDSDFLLNYYISNQDEIFIKAESSFNEILLSKVERLKTDCDRILNFVEKDGKEYLYFSKIKAQLENINKKNTCKKNIELILEIQFERSNGIDKDLLEEKDLFIKFLKKVKEFNISVFFEKNELVESILLFYKIYKEKLLQLKENENCLDFNDLESITLNMIDDDLILNSIIENFDFVFIDEYQDTNPVQEKILKIIAKNSNFMAVGDPKQGIYGFRNATSEIMKKDIKDKETSVYYLHSNFRSDSRILKFIDEIFEKIMLEENTGINYKETSKFEPMGEYKNTKKAAVCIDILKSKKEENVLKQSGVYDIFQSDLMKKNKYYTEAELLVQRVNEILLEDIYDLKKKIFRKTRYNDITILLRGKGELADEIISAFSRHQIPIISNIENDIRQNVEIEVLINFLKLCIDIQDDVALLSVLTSKLESIALDDLLEIKKSDREKTLYDLYQQNLFVSLKNDIDKFKVLSKSKGIRIAFENLFNEKDYFEYLLLKQDGMTLKLQIEKFLDIIESSEYNYDIPGLLKYISNNDIKVDASLGGGDAVTLTTIHASKGLEYPVVFLVGLGKDLTKKDGRKGYYDYDICKEYGLSLMTFNYDKDSKETNVVLEVAKNNRQKKEIIDELMLLYVAMTRAKNYLYLQGSCDLKEIKPFTNSTDIFEQKSYMCMILTSLYNKIRDLDNKKSIQLENFEINYFDDLIINRNENNKIKKIKKIDKNIKNEIEKYLNYNYLYKDAINEKLKRSVTELNNDENIQFKNIGGENNLEIGNAYHNALELIDFNKIEKINDVIDFLENFENKELINPLVLFNDIMLIKPFIGSNKIFKEKKFTMEINLKEIGYNVNELIMIQGAIDLFIIGEKNILIDYKYSNTSDPEKIIKKYKKQLILYKNAIENAYNIKIFEVYILLLKNSKLIKINI